MIPPKKNRKEQCEYDECLYELRHLVENCFLVLKRWRVLPLVMQKLQTLFLLRYKFVVSTFGLPFVSNSCRHYLG